MNRFISLLKDFSVNLGSFAFRLLRGLFHFQQLQEEPRPPEDANDDTPEMPRKPLPELPIEVWEQVIEWAYLQELAIWRLPRNQSHAAATCAQVCRAWVPRSRYYLSRRVEIRSGKDLIQATDALRRWARSGLSIQTLVIWPDPLSDVSKDYWVSSVPIKLSKTLGTVEELIIYFIDLRKVHSIFVSSVGTLGRSLRKVDFANVDFATLEQFARLVFSLPLLKELRLRGVELQARPLPQHQQQVHHLLLPAPQDLTWPTTERSLRVHLESFTLRTHYEDEVTFLQWLLPISATSSFESLTILDLDNYRVPFLHVQYVVLFVEKCHRLTRLSIKIWGDQIDATSHINLTHHTELSSLTFSISWKKEKSENVAALFPPISTTLDTVASDAMRFIQITLQGDISVDELQSIPWDALDVTLDKPIFSKLESVEIERPFAHIQEEDNPSEITFQSFIPRALPKLHKRGILLAA
ncbi:hypothetical protein C8Q75DRAFT_763181 [Abortiporus biennis]|nr:hypothetical protein C8Q75DRAFT_763181 [Abortiporus biennis]